MTKSYDRQPGETAKSWAAFCLYRDMRASRSLAAAASEFYTPNSPQKRPRNVSQFESWSSQWNWVQRCYDFDQDEEMLRRQQHREQDIEAHDRRLEYFRRQNEEIGFGLLELGAKMLVVIEAILEPILVKLRDGETLNKADLQTILSLPNAVKAMAHYSVLGSNLAADGLLIRQLMEKLKENS